ncbi:MAG: 4-(cytidine 5'-diphospho)-2-C-methyl-D-erythritol kinase [Clostridiales Family XIII bacterium]|jgi:4-diphosphocytidyl-2-C-methyl-D-erythritol kinase|nr:4-(cytidine 5'-diphospho)-2-C-methyl-D-erythritol kinase [Clostridiales Family XIII bacterium]
MTAHSAETRPRADSTITVKSYAKINLSLDVLSRLPNGYHSIRTVMQQVDLFDTVSVSVRNAGAPAAKSDGAGARIALLAESDGIDIAELPTDERNTALRAARAFLAEFAPRFSGCIDIRLQKRVPLAAGLAGGSGNAAAVILALARLLAPTDAAPAHTEAARLMELGSRIGADVPFCIMGQAALNRELGFAGNRTATCALAEGVGEKLTPLPSPGGAVIIVKPAVSVSTAAVYAGLNLSAISKRPDTDALVAGIKADDCGKIRKNMINVLEIAVLKEYPEIAAAKERLAADKNAECALMSGSGSSVFAWYRDISVCETALGALRREGIDVRMAKLQ